MVREQMVKFEVKLNEFMVIPNFTSLGNGLRVS